MTKIHILGGSGSGKTTLAQNLSSMLQVPYYDLDRIGLEKGMVTEDDAFAIAEQPGWIAEGIYLIFTEPLCGIYSRIDKDYSKLTGKCPCACVSPKSTRATAINAG